MSNDLPRRISLKNRSFSLNCTSFCENILLSIIHCLLSNIQCNWLQHQQYFIHNWHIFFIKTILWHLYWILSVLKPLFKIQPQASCSFIQLAKEMLSIPLIFLFVIICIVFLLKHIRASILHYERPKLFPPGPSQVRSSKVKTRNLLNNS